ncbi:MAG: Ig-like domain-containing protein [Dermatophilaceae bacterium]
MAATLLHLSKATIAKVALPAIAVAAAAGYAVAAPSADATGPGVWLDSPLMGSVLRAGMVQVQGHASAASPISSMSLLVDGADVSSTTTLEHRGNLSYATLPWQATAGTHQLQIRAGALTSMVVIVQVGDQPTTTQPTVVGPSIGAPTTAPTSAPAMSTPPAPATTAPPTTRPPTRPTTRPAPVSTPPTAPPPPPPPPTSVVPAPTILRTLVSQPLDNYPGCGGTTQVTVTAEITGATSATFVWQVAGVRGSGTMSVVSGTTWRGTSPTDLYTAGAPEGTLTVTVTATGPGGTRTSTATATVRTCKP